MANDFSAGFGEMFLRRVAELRFCQLMGYKLKDYRYAKMLGQEDEYCKMMDRNKKEYDKKCWDNFKSKYYAE